MVDLRGHEAEQPADEGGLPAPCVEGRRAWHVAAEEGDEVGAGLGDDEVIDIEEFGDAG